ncbi:MAG: magnesium/cobalt transporter CorA [Candidatus Poribacteria bacterium]|nr:magnesium/cobalt transporter CorA [Candidatus Poribacteria bacterium]
MKIPGAKLLKTRLFKRYSQKVGLPPGSLVYIGEERTEPVQITVTDYNATHFHEEEVQTIKECLPFKDTATVTWVHIKGVHESQIIEEIGEHFKINSLVLEDLMSPTQIPKIEIYEDYIFIILKSLDYDETSLSVFREQISLIIGKNFVISLQENSGSILAPVHNRLQNANGRIRKRQSDYLAYALIDVIVDHYFIALEQLSDAIQAVEEESIANPTSEVLEKINILRRECLLLRRPLLPLRDVIDEVLDGEIPLLSQDTHLYFRDVYDHLIQIIHTLETLRSAASGLFDTYTSAVSHRMNEVMKVLTIVATFFIPLTFIAGIYGMNFKSMPELEAQWGYPAVLLVMVAIGIGMFIYFKFKKWF